MPQPPAYNRTKDFTENFGTETDHSGLNAELDKVSNSINDVRANLAILQADDGKLRPEVVTPESVAPALFSLIVDEVKSDAVQLLADANAASDNAITQADTATAAAASATASKNAAAAHEANAATYAGQAQAAIGQPADGTVTDAKVAAGSKLKNRIDDLVSVKDAGAVGDGVTGDSAAVAARITAKHLSFPAGRYRLQSKVDFQPNAVTLSGSASGSTIVIADAAEKTALRFGAVGESDRQVTKVEGLSFESEVAGGTGVDAQAVFPFFMDTLRFYGVGGNAIKLFQIYYGRAENIILRDSGLNFVNVNNYSIDGGDISGIPSSSNYGATDWGSTLTDCDGVSFHNLTFETWTSSRAIKLVDCKNITFNSAWFEANTCDEVIRLEQTTATAFNDCFLELLPTPGAAFIGVDNSNVPGVARTLVTNVAVRGGHIRMDTNRTTAPPFINVAPGSKASLHVDGSTIEGGHLFCRGDAQIIARNLTLSSATESIDKVKTLHSLPSAVLQNNYNSWVPGSVQADWDFALGADMVEVETAALTIGLGTGDGEFMTGSKGVKISGIPSNGTRYVIQKMMDDMGPVTIEGQTHLIFVRFKPSADMSIIFAVEGFYMEYEIAPDITFKGNQWHDFVFKTASDNTYAQGRQGDPKLHIKVANTSGATANLFIDRIDYKTVQGDVYLP